jgi:superfamily I DNA/RNA helicase
MADLKAKQKAARKQCLENILASEARWKLIAAGPGTGKTYTFREILAQRAGGNNLAITFINKLADEMKSALGENAEVKTFHAYCKKILHEQNGRVDLAPYLTLIIERDAEILGNGFSDFTAKFQTLAEKSPEMAFHLKRGDYYEAVGFDDAVYRLLKQVQTNPDVLPNFDQIVVDEFQDFNPLEVAFIREIARKGNLLIVGDDDQAVYSGRSASPKYLRQLFGSGKFETFPLPYCSRCTSVVVDAIKNIIQRAQALGLLNNRIPKPYECYLESKGADSLRYPKILLARCTLAKVIPKYIKREIERISPDDIAESRAEKDGYPTVLIVGNKQYLVEIEKQLKPLFPQLEYTPSQDYEYGICEAYEWLRRAEKSNLGWRIILEVCCSAKILKQAVQASESGKPMVELLDSKLVKRHLRVLNILNRVADGDTLTRAEIDELESILGSETGNVIDHFTTKEIIEAEELNKLYPTIKLTSYVGCKGLSAGHVFIVGVNAGSIPKNPAEIQDLEISQFIVALTRTRKCCHILSNKWLVKPTDREGNYQQPDVPSPFISWIGAGLISNRGELSAKDFK